MPNWRSLFRPGDRMAPQLPPADTDIAERVNAVYYPNWRVYRQQPPSSLRLGFVSHVFYAFAWY